MGAPTSGTVLCQEPRLARLVADTLFSPCFLFKFSFSSGSKFRKFLKGHFALFSSGLHRPSWHARWLEVSCVLLLFSSFPASVFNLAILLPFLFYPVHYGIYILDRFTVDPSGTYTYIVDSSSPLAHTNSYPRLTKRTRISRIAYTSHVPHATHDPYTQWISSAQ